MMNPLLRWLIERYRHLHGNHPDLKTQEDLYASMSDKESLMEPVHDDAGTRTRSIHVIGSLASSDGVAWDEDKLDYEDENQVTTSITYREARRCDCGAALGYTQGAQLLGTCMICGIVVCSQEECHAYCSVCGILICRSHAFRYEECIFCSRHRMNQWWHWFWRY